MFSFALLGVGALDLWPTISRPTRPPPPLENRPGNPDWPDR